MLRLVVVHDLYVVGTTTAPSKSDSPLIVNPNRVKVLSISLELFEPVTGRGPEIPQVRRLVEILQLPPSRATQVGRKRPCCFRALVVKKVFGQGISEGLDHVPILSELDNRRNLEWTRPQAVRVSHTAPKAAAILAPLEPLLRELVAPRRC